MCRLVYIGLVDEHEELHVLHVTADAIPAAIERGWMALDEKTLGLEQAPQRDDGA
jgi:hypothetical protein